jgi:hypothetical protein
MRKQVTEKEVKETMEIMAKEIAKDKAKRDKRLESLRPAVAV